jgi:hypothetical protein
MKSSVFLTDLLAAHEPPLRSADRLIRELLPVNPRGLSGPRSEGRFTESHTARAWTSWANRSKLRS